MYALILLELLNGASHVTVREELVRSSNLKFRGAAGATERMARSVILWEKISAICVMRTGVKGGARSVCWNKGYFFIFMPERYCRSQKKKHLKTCLHLTKWLAIKIWGRNLEDFLRNYFPGLCAHVVYFKLLLPSIKIDKKRMSHAYYFLKKSNTIFYFLGGGVGVGGSISLWKKSQSFGRFLFLIVLVCKVTMHFSSDLGLDISWPFVKLMVTQYSVAGIRSGMTALLTFLRFPGVSPATRMVFLWP